MSSITHVEKCQINLNTNESALGQLGQTQKYDIRLDQLQDRWIRLITIYFDQLGYDMNKSDHNRVRNSIKLNLRSDHVNFR